MMSQKPHSRTDSAQAKRFIKAAREAGCSEDEAEIRENIRHIASAKVKKSEAPK